MSKTIKELQKELKKSQEELNELQDNYNTFYTKLNKLTEELNQKYPKWRNEISNFNKKINKLSGEMHSPSYNNFNTLNITYYVDLEMQSLGFLPLNNSDTQKIRKELYDILYKLAVIKKYERKYDFMVNIEYKMDQIEEQLKLKTAQLSVRRKLTEKEGDVDNLDSIIGQYVTSKQGGKTLKKSAKKTRKSRKSHKQRRKSRKFRKSRKSRN